VTRPLTQRFRDLYALGRLWPKWLRFLWLGLLVWLEEKYLDALTRQRVTEAIDEWHREEQILNPTVTWKDVEVEVMPSEVPGLPDLRIHAPWVDREVGYDRE
jgi:hypothetical protein